MPLVSVCIPVYNGAKYLVETIASVQKQTFQDFEILIQDNKSTDDTWKIVLEQAARDPRIHPEQNASNLGMAMNWNVALDRPKSEFMMLLSADDLLEPSFLEVALVKFRDDPSLGTVSFNHSLIEGGKYWIREMDLAAGKYSQRADIVLLKNPYSVNFSLYRTGFLNSIRRVGRIFGHFYTCDFGLHIRVAMTAVPLLYVDEPLGIYRVHGTQLSNQSSRMRRQKALTTLSLKKDLLPKYAWSYRYCLTRPLVGTVLATLRGQKFDRKLFVVVLRRVLRTFIGKQ